MFNKLNNNKIFEELYCFILMLIAFLFYCVSSVAGMIIIIMIAILSLILFKDFKYMIPCVLYFIFSNSSNYDNTDFPMPIIICGILFIVILIIFMFKNKIKLTNLKSYKGILLLGIANIFPILWHNVIPVGSEVLYILYLAYLFYFLIYALFATSLNKNPFSMLYKAMTYLAILIALECIYNVIIIHSQTPNQNVLNLWYYIGWGLCNEAGIMMCFLLPFIFVSVIKAEHKRNILAAFIKILIVLVGMILTTSRGTIIFGIFELILLCIWSLIKSKKKLGLSMIYSAILVLGLITIHITYGLDELILDIKTHIFSLKLSDNGRFSLWKQAVNIWKQDFVRMTFGSGMVTEFLPDSIRYVVYHSTFFEVLAKVGNLGIAFLIIHFIEKYKQLMKFESMYIGLFIIGYIVVDLYGLIDNTYGMYYYMIPLMITMACFDSKSNIEEGI